MKKNELQEKFRVLLENRQERLKKATKLNDQMSGLMAYGEICGLAAAMKTIGLIDYEQSEYIKEQAWALHEGKEPADEAC